MYMEEESHAQANVYCNAYAVVPMACSEPLNEATRYPCCVMAYLRAF